MNYIIYFNFDDKIYEYPLPSVNNRDIEISIPQINLDCVINLEVYDGIWTMLANENIKLYNGKDAVSEHVICDDDVINFVYKDTLNFAAIILMSSKDLITYTKFVISDKNRVIIGNGPQADINIDNKYISSVHAVITKASDGHYISDKSTNKCYINGRRVDEDKKLKAFDEIYVVGYKLIYLGNYIAVNREKGVSIKLSPLDRNNVHFIDADTSERTEFFSRSPGVVVPPDCETVEIELPAVPQVKKEQPLMFLIGPSLTMPLPMIY